MTRKRKIKKTPKKVKKLLHQFGLDDKRAPYVDTVQELVNDKPRYIRFRVKNNFEITDDLTKVKIQLVSGNDYITTISAYMQMRKSQSVKNSIEPSKKTFIETFRRYYNQDLTNKSLLIWRYGGIGDLIMIQPLVQYLKDHYKNCKIIFATSIENIKLLQLWPKGLVDQIITIPIDSRIFDICDYHLTFEGTLERCKELKIENGVRMYAKVAGIDLDTNVYTPRLLVPENKRLENDLPLLLDNNLVILQYSSSTANRSMAPVVAAELISILTENGYTVGILDTPIRAKEIDFIFNIALSRNISEPSKVLNLSYYSRDLVDCAYILSKSIGIIAVDSAISHMGPALNIPTVGVYTSFPGKTRIAAYKNVDWFDVSTKWNGCGKCPCYLLGFELNKCPYVSKKMEPACIYSIDVVEIFDKFVKLIGREKDSYLRRVRKTNVDEFYKERIETRFHLIRNKTTNETKVATVFNVGQEEVLIERYLTKTENCKRYKSKDIDLNNKKLIIYRYSGIGDILNIQPLIKQLKKLYQNLEISLSTRTLWHQLLSDFLPKGYVKNLFDYTSVSKDIFESHDYHLILDNVIEFQYALFDDLKTNMLSEAFIRYVGFKYDEIDDWSYELLLDDSVAKEYQNLVEDPQKSIVVSLVSTTSISRTIKDLKIIEILNLLGESGFKVLIVGSNSEQNHYLRVLNNKKLLFREGSFIKYLIPEVHSNWPKLLSVIKNSSITLCVDNGISHISASLNKPTYVIYTSFLSHLTWFDKFDYYEVSKNWNTCKLAPCEFHNTLYRCPYARNYLHPGCSFEGVDSLKIVEGVVNLLDRIETTKKGETDK